MAVTRRLVGYASGSARTSALGRSLREHRDLFTVLTLWVPYVLFQTPALLHLFIGGTLPSLSSKPPSLPFYDIPLSHLAFYAGCFYVNAMIFGSLVLIGTNEVLAQNGRRAAAICAGCLILQIILIALDPLQVLVLFQYLIG